MEEGLSEIFYTLFYILISACIIYPPIEFISAGVTIPMVLSPILGSETQEFIQYHIRRSSATLLVYSFMPFGYFCGLRFFGYREDFDFLWNMEGYPFKHIVVATTVILPTAALCQVFKWALNDWEYHPIAINVSKFCNNFTISWQSVASDINNEYRRIDKVRIQSNAVCKIIATESWIIKITPLSLSTTHQADATLEVNHSDSHYLSPDTVGVVQYINIDVKSSRQGVRAFTIRINADYFRDLQDRISTTIAVLPNISFHKTVVEKFIDAFKEVVAENPRFSTEEELEDCIGCMQTVANIKLQKFCNGPAAEGDQCMPCYCRPMWCVDCMGKWFALRQDQDHQETWLSSKCTCPMCRAKFCLLDVCFIDQEIFS